MIDKEKLDFYLMQLGHDDFVRGTDFLRQAVKIWDREGHPALTDLLYPEIAAANQSTPTCVERAIRHSIEKAWGRGNSRLQHELFGFSYSPISGKPTNGEYISRLARLVIV